MAKILKDVCLPTELAKTANQTVIAATFNDCSGNPLSPGDQIAKCSDIPAPQTLSISGQNLTISGGNTVALPAAPSETVTTLTGVLPAGTVIGTYTNEAGVTVTLRVPASVTPDGSETKIIAGDNVDVSGSGTTADPYIVSSPTKLFVKEIWGGTDNTNVNVNASFMTTGNGNISITNPYSYPIEVVETAFVAEVACLNIGYAGVGNVGARLQRSTNGGVTWNNHSHAGFMAIPVPDIGEQGEFLGMEESYKHTVAPAGTLTIQYRVQRIVGIAAPGPNVSIFSTNCTAYIQQL